MSSHKFVAGATYQELIRSQREEDGFDKWGFVIYRCTYTSQEKWDEFLSYLQEDASDLLRSSEDADLRDSLEWKVFEDASTLDGISWMDARKLHDEWVLAEIEKERIAAQEAHDEEVQDSLAQKIWKQPRFEYFIFVDEPSIDSVIEEGRTGLYYIILVKTKLLFDPDEEKEWVECGWPSAEEKGEGYQWFKAGDIVRLFAATCRSDPWENHPYVDGEEVCEVVSM